MAPAEQLIDIMFQPCSAVQSWKSITDRDVSLHGTAVGGPWKRTVQ